MDGRLGKIRYIQLFISFLLKCIDLKQVVRLQVDDALLLRMNSRYLLEMSRYSVTIEPELKTIVTYFYTLLKDIRCLMFKNFRI